MIQILFQSNKINGCLRELAYFSLRDSAPIWEVNVAHRWKPLTLELAAWIEDRWKQDLKKAQMKELVHVSPSFNLHFRIAQRK